MTTGKALLGILAGIAAGAVKGTKAEKVYAKKARIWRMRLTIRSMKNSKTYSSQFQEK
jgi:hypothetical protein